MPHTFRQRFFAARCLWQELLTFWDGVASEADSLIGVEDGSLSDEAANTTHAAVHHVHSHLSHLLLAVLLPGNRENQNFVCFYNFFFNSRELVQVQVYP